MHQFRARLRGDLVEPEILVSKKPLRSAGDRRLAAAIIRRSEKRKSDGRVGTRHRLSAETVSIAGDCEGHTVTLINMSEGGAMIEGEFNAQLHEVVDLHLGDSHRLRCSVKWLKGKRAGLEFLPGTQVGCTKAELDGLVRDVVARTYPDLKIDDEITAPPNEQAYESDDARDDQRHGLIWSATLHHDFQSTTVRLRNISASGALIECERTLPIGGTPLLEVGTCAPVNCQVVWSFGNQAGLRFEESFDISVLRTSRPLLSPPAGFRTRASGKLLELDQLSGTELQNYLEGFLKR